ncbi:hypothetical protein NQ317_012376 [Molorchus minor]|uniref:Uncharacterized protein n=1 Tax=Molorchus minor TaxID=1323400 RepID=A0ABQ9JP82_9CUCU|nr:hypothetical protein NQ317_000732 [Molorchus minor]KAJ8975742.1 hypothetical protein NQ317_015364 [Molorchus minor]KAJ8979869.1 hypothetical protein NQ317_016054 [Molorchus minor]KAJ8980074.1 hypothetical protein NQ317_012376 [Molorchus minor]
MFLGARNRLQLFPKRSEHSRVLGIDCDYSRNDPSPPDLTRTPPKPKTTVFGVFPYIFRYRESIWITPEAIQAPSNFPDFSRALPKYE